MLIFLFPKIFASMLKLYHLILILAKMLALSRSNYVLNGGFEAPALNSSLIPENYT